MARGQNKTVRTVITDRPIESEPANSGSVLTVRQTDADEGMSTTQRLFGDVLEEGALTREDHPLSTTPVPQSPMDEIAPVPIVTPDKTQQQSATQQPVTPPQTPPESTPPTPSASEFDWEKKAKVKVDGQELEVPLKELRDQYQIKKHWQAVGDKIGDERRRLAEERQEFLRLRQQSGNGQPVDIGQTQQFQLRPQSNTPPMQSNQDPYLQRLAQLEQRFVAFEQSTTPVLTNANRMRVDMELKSEGYQDFTDYLPKMEGFLLDLSNKNPALAAFYDTPEGSKALYKQLKADDFIRSPRAPQAVPTQQPTAQIVGVPVPTSRPPIMRVEGGAQSSTPGNNDDSAYTYRKDFQRAVALGRDIEASESERREAWNKVLMQKNILPQ